MKNQMIAGLLAGCISFAAMAGPSAPPQPVNIATASAAEFEQLPGVGPSKAKAIITYREAHPFASIDDLEKVAGIGPKLVDRLRPYLTAQGMSPTQNVTRPTTTPPTAGGR